MNEERKTSAWDAIFGDRERPTNRAERRKAERELASRIRRNQRAYARRMKEEKNGQ